MTKEYKIAYYFTRFGSTGLDDYEDAPSMEKAIATARKRVKGSSPFGAQAVITWYGGIVATVTRSNGRVLTKKR